MDCSAVRLMLFVVFEDGQVLKFEFSDQVVTCLGDYIKLVKPDVRCKSFYTAYSIVT